MHRVVLNPYSFACVREAKSAIGSCGANETHNMYGPDTSMYQSRQTYQLMRYLGRRSFAVVADETSMLSEVEFEYRHAACTCSNHMSNRFCPMCTCPICEGPVTTCSNWPQHSVPTQRALVEPTATGQFFKDLTEQVFARAHGQNLRSNEVGCESYNLLGAVWDKSDHAFACAVPGTQVVPILRFTVSLNHNVPLLVKISSSSSSSSSGSSIFGGDLLSNVMQWNGDTNLHAQHGGEWAYALGDAGVLTWQHVLFVLGDRVHGQRSDTRVTFLEERVLSARKPLKGQYVTNVSREHALELAVLALQYGALTAGGCTWLSSSESRTSNLSHQQLQQQQQQHRLTQYNVFGGLRVFLDSNVQTARSGAVPGSFVTEFTVTVGLDTCALAHGSGLTEVIYAFLSASEALKCDLQSWQRSRNNPKLETFKAMRDDAVQTCSVDTFLEFVERHGGKTDGAHADADTEDVVVTAERKMNIKLYEHQKRVLRWMHAKESRQSSTWDDVLIPVYVYGLEAPPLYLFPHGMCILYVVPHAPVGGIVCDEMGLGKTIEAAALMVSALPERQHNHENRDHVRKRARRRSGASGPAESALRPATTGLTQSGFDFQYEHTMHTGAGPHAKLFTPTARQHWTGENLVVCPKTMVHVWKSELEKRMRTESQVRVLVYCGSARRKVSPASLRQADVVITTYDTLAADSRSAALKKDLNLDTLCNVKWRRAVFDEAHIVCNNSTTAAYTSSVNLCCRYKWLLSGTAMGNKALTLCNMAALAGLHLRISPSNATPYLMSGVLSHAATAISIRHTKASANELHALAAGSHSCPAQCQADGHAHDQVHAAAAAAEPFVLCGSANEWNDVVVEICPYDAFRPVCDAYDQAWSRMQSLHEQARSIVSEIRGSPFRFENQGMHVFSTLRKVMSSCIPSRITISTLHVELVPMHRGSHFAESSGPTANDHQQQLTNVVVLRLSDVFRDTDDQGRCVCPVCWDDELIEPCAGPCKHLLCKACAITICRTSRKCPVCRSNMTIAGLMRVVIPTAPSVDTDATHDSSAASPNPSNATSDASSMCLSMSPLPSPGVGGPAHAEMECAMCPATLSACQHFLDDAADIEPCAATRQQRYNAYMSACRAHGTFMMHPKVTSLVTILSALRPGVKVVVYCASSQLCASLQDALPNTIRILDGAMSAARRNDVLRDFEDPHTGHQVLCTTYKVGAVGLTLTCAHIVVLMDTFPNASAVQQAIHRVCRIGQKRKVTVFRLVIRDSVEHTYLQNHISSGCYTTSMSNDRGQSVWSGRSGSAHRQQQRQAAMLMLRSVSMSETFESIIANTRPFDLVVDLTSS